MLNEDQPHLVGPTRRDSHSLTADDRNHDRTHYDVIGLRLFEDDEAEIAAAIDRLFLLVTLELSLDADGQAEPTVREQVQAIAATLIDPEARRRYDARLRDQIAAAGAATHENSQLATTGGKLGSPAQGVYPYGLVAARLAPV